jgi:hypothetical protein
MIVFMNVITRGLPRVFAEVVGQLKPMNNVIPPALVLITVIGSTPVLAQDSLSRIDVGVHGVVNTIQPTGGRVNNDVRVGAHVTVGILRRVDFSLMLNAFGASTPWQAVSSLKVRPLGTNSPWYVGAGATAFRYSSPTQTEFYEHLLTGIEIPLAPVRPFVELHWYAWVTEHNLNALGLFLGVTVSVP